MSSSRRTASPLPSAPLARPAVWNAAALSAALGGLTALLGCGHGAPSEAPPRPVRLAVVESHAARSSVRYSATIQAHRQIPIAFKVAGRVAGIAQRPGLDGKPRDLQAGDRVAAGEVLARLEDGEYRDRLKAAEAAFAQAEAAKGKAQADAARAEALFASHSLTKPDLDGARAAKEAAEAQSRGARAQADALRVSLDECALRSPYAGVIVSRAIENGSLVGVGAVGFVVAESGAAKAVFGAPDEVVKRLALGQPLQVTLDRGASSLRAEIESIGPAADAQSRVFPVELHIPNPDATLQPGMIATVEVPLGAAAGPAAGALLAPLEAIVSRKEPDTGYAVLAFEADAAASDRGVARLRPVELGEVAGNRIEVRSGLKAGERVIVSGAALIADGDKVREVPQ